MPQAEVELLQKCEVGVSVTLSYYGDAHIGECLDATVGVVICWCNANAWLHNTSADRPYL